MDVVRVMFLDLLSISPFQVNELCAKQRAAFGSNYIVTCWTNGRRKVDFCYRT